MKNALRKTFTFFTILSGIVLVYKCFTDVKSTDLITIQRAISSTPSTLKNRNESMKYILQWTSDKTIPFQYMGKGQNVFLERNCSYVNCYVTSTKYFLGDYTKFDAIIFHGPELLMPTDVLLFPERRSAWQKYVFTSIESAGYYQACTKRFNGYFNWTWTYKLNSDVRWGYIVIRDKDNSIIGPQQDMNWLKLEDMDPVSEDFKNKLKTKRKAAAWFVSNCFSISEREIFVQYLQEELMTNYKQVIDIYGACRTLTCSMDREKECDKKIADTYYFYLSFENSFSEDYVTEKLLRALNNDAVPIVFGGANYTRFMPNGIYLNARELGISKLAAKMNELINNPDEYAKYFKWKNHYSYHKTTDSVETDEYCKMCEILNNEEAMTKTTVYEDFQQWWDVPNSCWQANKDY